MTGERVIGVVAMQDYPQHRYAETDVHLLSTITAGMGVALENARLFEEANRLLAETEQRSTPPWNKLVSIRCRSGTPDLPGAI